MSNKVDGLHIEQGLVYQEVDFEKIFGVDVSDPLFRPLKERFAQKCIDVIQDRCRRGLDFRGKKLPSYSESYVDSAAFKAYEKSKNNPNEKLRGDMLATLDVIKNEGNVIQFGWNDSENAEKARGHITGYEGHPVLKGSPKREFFGLTGKQLQDVMLEFESDFKQSDNKNKNEVVDLLLAYLTEAEKKKQEQELAKILGIGFDGFN